MTGRVFQVTVLPLALAVVLAALGLTAGAGCSGEDGAATGDPDDGVILSRYLKDHPELVAGHEHWHTENYQAQPDYGDLFLAFHRKLIRNFDAWRAGHGFAPLRPWDPATPIPADAPHAGRQSDNPGAVDRWCRRPGWLTIEGGTIRDPDFGAARLPDYTSTNQLGRAIDTLTPPYWHTRVHATIGGDMANEHLVVLDPIFWRFHKFIDHIWDEWLQATGNPEPDNTPAQTTPDAGQGQDTP